MHSHDRTLLANLGFSDPDKRDKRHDLACEYLGLRENSIAVLKAIGVEGSRPYHQPYDPRFGETRGTTTTKITSVGSPVLECAVSKGEGQYRTTVGFLDLILRYVVERVSVGEDRQIKDGVWKPASDTCKQDEAAVVEVKIGTVGVGEILRQINLYREFISAEHYWKYPVRQWVVATFYDLQASEVEQLKNARVHHVKLGGRFEAFLRDRAERRDIPSESPEI